MEQIIDKFFSLDAIASEQSKHELMEIGEESLDLVIDQFYKKGNSSHLAMQLGDLFGHFGNAALPRLLSIFEKGEWFAMIMATPCFSKLPHEPAGSQLMQFVSSGGIDKERLAIEAIGYLGTPDWSFELINKVKNNDGYDWEKLSPYLFATFFRIAVKATSQDAFSNAFYYIKTFYKRAESEKFRRLWTKQWYRMEIIFSNFKPVAADIIMSDWLKHEDSFFRELGLKALGWMRLNRAVKVIKKIALSGKETEGIIRQCADSLSIIDSVDSANALKAIYDVTEKASELYSHIALHMAMALGRLSNRGIIEQIYPI